MGIVFLIQFSFCFTTLDQLIYNLMRSGTKIVNVNHYYSCNCISIVLIVCSVPFIVCGFVCCVLFEDGV
jgi:hypothetical protein